MTKTIALAGKGGTGKTTIAALLIRSLLKRTSQPILAIDADPATNLHLALGLAMPVTAGEIREEMMETAQAGQLGVTISRHEYLSREIRMALEEGDQVDLLAMGRPEGQGCYCAVNHLLRQIVDEMGRSYEFVVIDNEAGMEHISRRTTKDVDLLLLVTDPTVRGLKTAAGIASMAREVEVNVKRTMLIINRVQGEMPPPLQAAVDELGLEIAGLVPADSRVNELDALGQPLLRLNGDSPALQAVEDMTARLMNTI
ncbi:MAG: AAA family ATPase [Anaerolineales bacterium]|nr:AAA family ATPase [Anaerolineales bacterium]